ncbi:MAG TPA: aminotransferase class I/II-fold pyridoxal phosphate-dependent enzyme [Acidimicrobiales bacterium]|nr:aminotransferase class I/II-fold pyridoxal phosphate-dependent enzyme [Acidimicrobiales bacterium]
MSWAEWVQGRNDKARAKARWRELKELDALGLRGKLPDGAVVVAFATNDYLGLSAHPRVIEAAHEALDRWGAGAGASRLITGSRPVHHELEERLAAWKSSASALVFPSGYGANLGVLEALAGPGVTLCCDMLNHASIIDGCRLASALGARVVHYPHADPSAADAALGSAPGRSVLVTDSVFSMDGDAAPISELAEICARHGALFVVDEAHAVLGPNFSELPCEVLRVGTLSKTLGSQGGFVASSRGMIDMLVNRCRSFIFTTALAPPSAAAALAALDVLLSGEGASLLRQLATYAQRLRPGPAITSPIIPFVVGSEQEALDASMSLLQMGALVPAVRPPAVPPGTSRLRVTVSAAHTQDEIELLAAALARLGLHGG